MKKMAIAVIIISCVSSLILVDFIKGEISRYESKGKRDPFVPLIGPDKAIVSDLGDITSIADVNLEGIAIGAKGRKVAIINGEMLKEGDKIGSLEIKSITKTTVVLIIGGKEYSLKLPEEGGPKGEK